MDYQDYQQGPVSPFGLSLLQLAEMEYETLDDALIDMSQTLGCDPEDIDDLIRGDILPEAEVVSVLADLFDTTVADEDAYEQFVETAIDTHEIAGLIESDEDDDEYDEYDVEDEYYDPYSDYVYEDEYGYDDEEAYEPEVEHALYRAQQAEARVIEFERNQFLQEQHGQLRYHAEQLVEDGVLPPVFFSRLFGNSSERGFANFSKSTELLGMDEEAHLSHIDYCLNLFREVGPLMNFSQIVEDPLQESINQQYDEVDSYLVQGMLSTLGYGNK